MNQKDRYDGLFQYYAERYNLNWRLIKKQAIAESSLNPYAESNRGAKGLMQFVDSTWEQFGEGDAFNPEESIKAGCKYMAYLYDKFKEIPDVNERYKFALAAYNCGRSNVNRMLAEARKGEGLPENYSEWAAQGAKKGIWQTWEFASRFLSIVTGRNSRETVNYVGKICEWGV